MFPQTGLRRPSASAGDGITRGWRATRGFLFRWATLITETESNQQRLPLDPVAAARR